MDAVFTASWAQCLHLHNPGNFIRSAPASTRCLCLVMQVWLAINNLVVEPKARAKYNMDEYRKDKLVGLKRYLNELMFDQLPVLKVSTAGGG